MPNTTSEWLWWGFSAIIIAIIINLISDYVKVKLEKSFEKLSINLKNKNEKNRKKIEERAKEIIRNPLLLHNYYSMVILLCILGSSIFPISFSLLVLATIASLNDNLVAALVSAKVVSIDNGITEKIPILIIALSILLLGGAIGYIKRIRDYLEILSMYWKIQKD